MKTSYALGAFVAALSLAAFAAVAQTVAPNSPSTTVSVGPVFDIFKPYLEMLAQLGAAAAVGAIAGLIQKFTGIKIEANHRDALQSALTNAVGAAYAKIEGPMRNIAVDVRSPFIANALNSFMAGGGAADAVAHFGLGPDRLREMLVAKVGILQAAEGTA